MSKRPFIHAFVAAAYIFLIATIVRISANFPEGDSNYFLAPVAFLSLFTLSAAIMGYLFLGEPVQLFLDGKKKEAVRFFAQTVVSFAVLTVVVFLEIVLERVL